MGLIADFRRDEVVNDGAVAQRDGRCRDRLDLYIEAHIHGGVKVPDDVEALVVDPSFADHAVVENAGRCGLVVETHPGYVAEVAEIAAHPEYRGQDVVDLAQRIAEDLANSMQLRPIHVARARRCETSTGSRARKSGTALRDSAGPGEPRRHFAGFISLSTTHL